MSVEELVQSGETVVPSDEVAMRLQHVSVSFRGKPAVRNVSFDVQRNAVTALIGPSGSGKTTLLRAINRLHDLTPKASVTGQIFLGTTRLYGDRVSVTELRSRIGMVFQRPNPFPTMSIYDNVATGLRVNGMTKKSELDDAVEYSLRGAALWESVQTRLKDRGGTLSGGEQQRVNAHPKRPHVRIETSHTWLMCKSASGTWSTPLSLRTFWFGTAWWRPEVGNFLPSSR